MTEELKCPYCGEDAKYVKSFELAYIACLNDGCKVQPDITTQNISQALAIWKALPKMEDK